MLFVLGTIWALPNSLIGFVLAWLGQTYPRELKGGIWRWIAAPFGIFQWFFTTFKFGAITFGNLQVYASERDWANPSEQLHENRHTWWTQILGLLFFPAYLIASLISLAKGTGFYWGNWFEKDARKAAEQ